jgi:hypothetical protein
MTMMALTVWQPWASLIVLGAKPWEFRHWDYTTRTRYAHLLGQRIVIHAGARAIKRDEIDDILARIADGTSALDGTIATPLLERIKAAYKGRGVIELSAGLGTAVIGMPRRVVFRGVIDSDRLDHSVYGWPLSDIQPFPHPVPCRGSQGFWRWPFNMESADG